MEGTKSSSEWRDASLASSDKKPSSIFKRVFTLSALLLFFPSSECFSKNFVAEAYSSFVRSMAHTITNDYQEVANTNLTTKQIEFNGQIVTYQYLLWRLRPQSVCANYKHDLLKYSDCGKSAKQLFNQTCMHLNKNPSDHWKHQKLQNLYCSAALEYQPVIAEAKRSNIQNEDELKQRQLCSALTVEAMSKRDSLTLQKRDNACKGVRR